MTPWTRLCLWEVLYLVVFNQTQVKLSLFIKAGITSAVITEQKDKQN